MGDKVETEERVRAPFPWASQLQSGWLIRSRSSCEWSLDVLSERR